MTPRVSLPSTELHCFELETAVALDVQVTGPEHKPGLSVQFCDVEFVDLQPQGFEDALECLAETFLTGASAEMVGKHVPSLRAAGSVPGAFSYDIRPSQPTVDIPRNPLIENDQLKVFLHAGFGEAAPAPPTKMLAVGGEVNRVRQDVGDIVLAIGEPAFGQLVVGALKSFRLINTHFATQSGPASYTLDLEAHLECAGVRFAGDAFVIDEMRVVWNQLSLGLGLEFLSEVCIGGWFPGMREECVFGDDPDVDFGIDLSGLVLPLFTLEGTIGCRYAQNPARPLGMSAWAASQGMLQDRWQIVVAPRIRLTSLTLLPEAAAVLITGLSKALQEAVDWLPWPLPEIAAALIGSTEFVLQKIVAGLGDALGLLDWLISSQFKLAQVLINWLTETFATTPINEIDDPLLLAEMLVPLEHIDVAIRDNELQILVDIRD